jgi:hypothetical protein
LTGSVGRQSGGHELDLATPAPAWCINRKAL